MTSLFYKKEVGLPNHFDMTDGEIMTYDSASGSLVGTQEVNVNVVATYSLRGAGGELEIKGSSVKFKDADTDAVFGTITGHGVFSTGLGAFNSGIISTGLQAGGASEDTILLGGPLTFSASSHHFTDQTGTTTHALVDSSGITTPAMSIGLAPYSFEWHAESSRVHNLSSFKLGGLYLEPPSDSTVVPLSVKQNHASQPLVALFYDDTANPILEILDTNTKVSKPVHVNNTHIDYYDGTGTLSLRHYGNTQFLGTDHLIQLQGHDFTINTEIGGDVNIGSLHVKQGGNIGVGSTAPQSTLHIKGDSSAIDSTDPSLNDYAQVEITSTSNVSGATRPGNLQIGFDHRPGNWGCGFVQGVVNNTYSSPVCLAPWGGNVGIGISAPSQKLHVNGSAKVTDAVHVGTKWAIRQQGTDLTFSHYSAPSANIVFNNTLSGAQTHLTVDGNILAQSFTTASDDRLKHNEEEVMHALKAINQLRLKKYDKTSNLYDEDFVGNLSNVLHRKEVGFIAQDVLKIPDLAWLVQGGGESVEHHVDEDGEMVAVTVKHPYSIEYQGLSNYAIQAIQELSKRVEELEARLVDLR